MKTLLGLYALAISCLDIANASPVHSTSAIRVEVPTDCADDGGIPMEAPLSYSIEFSSFVDYAGNSSAPNDFSNNLLNNLGNLTGSKPFIRVGGNTQDYALFDASLPVAQVGIVIPSVSPDYPRNLTIGPLFYDSFNTWPDTKYIYGFNLADNTTLGRQFLLNTAQYACKTLANGKLAYWELGNEPDLYSTSAQGPRRPLSWHEADYVREWLNGTRTIHSTIAQYCPSLASNNSFKFYAPSFAGTSANHLNPITTWLDGLDTDKDIGIISSHNYIGGATQPGVTLQGTLMNHTKTTASVAQQLNESRILSTLPQSLNPSLPFILGETNSLYNQGAPGLSNSFGAALWGVDFALYCLANNISRIHFHQGTNYRYQSWQPVETNITAKGTKAPYYGNVAVAAFVGDVGGEDVRVANLPLSGETKAAYAAFVGERLRRVLLVDLSEYNATAGNNYTDEYARPVAEYEVGVQGFKNGRVGLRRLMANGSDAITGITFDGYSYNYELDAGRPVLLQNVTRGETAVVKNGLVKVDVPASSAVILDFGC